MECFHHIHLSFNIGQRAGILIRRKAIHLL
ncbi:hypothetical protein [Escherichia phage Ecp_YSF]|nr:hypothetical protein [Escherichia phage Ecp_YSF]